MRNFAHLKRYDFKIYENYLLEIFLVTALTCDAAIFWLL